MRHVRSIRNVSIAVLSISVLGGSFLTPLSAQARDLPPQTVSETNPGPDLPEMKQHEASAFAGEAAQLPKGLKDAIKRDLKKSPEEYLAEAETAKDASDLQVELAKRGVQVTHSELVNGKLKLRVATEAQAKLARKSGADVTVGPADPPKPAIAAKALASNNGTGWAHFAPGSSQGEACSIGFYGYDKSDGQQQFLTAGHCDPGANPISRIDLASAGQLESATLVPTASTPVAGTFQFGGGRDAGLIKPDAAKFGATDVVETWEGSRTGRPSITSMRLRGAVVATVGAPLCKSGITTGWTCGAVEQVNVSVSFDEGNTVLVNSIISSACGDHGDSGGANLIGQYAVGITSGGGEPCGGADPFLSSYPLRSTDSSKSSAMAAYDWEPRVQTIAPSVSAGAGMVDPGTKLVGTVAGGDASYRVDVYWDGASSPSQTVTLAANGGFSANEPSTAGPHSYKLIARWGIRNASAATTGSITVRPWLARSASNATVFLVVDSVKYPIPNMDLLAALAPLGAVSMVPQSSLDSLPTKQAATRILRGPTGAMYFADGGKKLPFASCTLVANWGGSCSGTGYTSLTNAQLARFPAGASMASLAKLPDGSRFWMVGGAKRELLDEASRTAAGAPSDTVAVTAAALAPRPFGTPVARDSVFVGERGTSTYWLLAGSKRSAISSGVATNVGVASRTAGYLATGSLLKLAAAAPFNGIVRGASDSQSSVLTTSGRWVWSRGTGTAAAYTPVAQSLANSFVLKGTIKPGDMVKAPSSATVYMVMSDKILPIESWDGLLALSGGATPVILDVADALAALAPKGPVALKLGTLARTAGDPSVFLVNGVTNKIWFASFEYPNSFGFTEFLYTTDSRLAAYPRSSQSLGYGVTCGTTSYVGAGGMAHSLTVATKALYPFSYVPLDEFTCRVMRKGAAANDFIRTPNGAIYQLVAGQKRHVATMERWQQLSGGKSPLDVNASFAAQIPSGPTA
ncbi:MAG TPA: S1 family peptidase [Candidatus Lumbricidophila sp.]|nr:S1 family peptidase [Candidatus Lumbricidophila sp.]